jgi:formiminotetrahydrofolate cyclodeaminase
MDSAWVPLLSIVAGSLLTAFGSFINGYVANRRQQKQWDREDRIRQEEQERADKRLMAEERVRAYKTFAVATTFTPPLRSGEDKEKRRTALSESYTDVLLHATDHVRQPAEVLQHLVRDMILDVNEDNVDPEMIKQLEEAREAFWYGVRVEMKDIPYKSRYMVVLPD